MLRSAVICELLDTFDIAFCEFDEELRAIRWNATFCVFFPEHAGFIHCGEHYSENLRRFYQCRLEANELPYIDRHIAEGVARHKQQHQPFNFTHRGRKLRVSSLPIPGSGRIRIWKEVGEIPAACGPDLPAFDALEFIADGACVTDLDGSILASNERFRTLYDVPNEGVIVGRSLEQLLTAAWHRASHASSLTATIRNRMRYDGAPFEIELPRDRWRRVIALHSKDGVTYSIHSDITAVKRQYRELATTKEELKKANVELSRLSNLDPLTDLPNRRAFADALASTSEAYVLMIDVDHFKTINDTHGHSIGDACLQRIAAVIGEVARSEGATPARIGGDEFAVILPNGSISRANLLAETLRRLIAENDWYAIDPAIESVTISIGVGPVGSIDGAKQEDADRALYRAKISGRNRVEKHLADSLRRTA